MDVPAHITGTVWKIEVTVGQKVAAGRRAGHPRVDEDGDAGRGPGGGHGEGDPLPARAGGERGRRAGRPGPVSADGQLRVSALPGGVRVLTLDRPQRRNALTPALLDALAAALAPDATVRALLVRGASGRRSAPGTTWGSWARTPRPTVRPTPASRTSWRSSRPIPRPSVAVVQGPAFGAGCELACACDFRLGTPEATLCMPPVRLGVVYAPDGVWRVARLAGLQRARELFLTARELGAPRRRGLGAARPGEPGCRGAGPGASPPSWPRGRRWRWSGSGAPSSSSAGHRSMPPPGPSWRRSAAEAFASADAQEARAAMREKRPPRWKGQ